MSIVAKKIMMGSGAVALPSDDQFNRVSFLSHFEGANNGVNNAFDDGSANNYTVTAAGNVTQGSFGPFARPDGEWGWSFDGDGDSLTFTNDATMSLDGDYTFELFFNARTIVIDTQHPNTWLSGTTQLFIHASDRYVGWYAGGADIVKSADDSILTNVWNHVAVVRSGTGSNNTSLYLNGTRVAQTQNTATLGAGSGTARIGSYSASGGNFDGHISNIRILKGTALYSGSSITVPTSALTAITNTKLLTCQSNRFIDNSSTGFALTPVGNAAVTSFGPFLTSAVYDPAVNGASAFLDGSGDTLRATWTAADIINQNFTLEYWLYFQETSGYGTVSIGANDSSASYVHLSYASNGQVFSDDGQNSGSGPSTSAGAIRPNSWNHLALVRVSNDMFIYINGAKIATKAITASLFQGQSAEFGIGYIANPLEGYICDARIVTSAVYTGSTYTVPTAPLTAITNTKLLLNMADGQAIDSAAQNNLTLFGNANTSTDQAKFGNTSLHLDGTGDFAKTELSTAFGTGDFTIECFYYNSASFASANRYLFDFGSNGLRIQFFNGTIYYFVDANNSVTTTASGVTHNNWYHLAAVRYNSQMNLYIGGVSRATKNSVTTNLTERSLTIGDYGGGGQALQGFIDDFRISNFARYTSNFTAPTAAFADKGQ